MRDGVLNSETSFWSALGSARKPSGGEGPVADDLAATDRRAGEGIRERSTEEARADGTSVALPWSSVACRGVLLAGMNATIWAIHPLIAPCTEETFGSIALSESAPFSRPCCETKLPGRHGISKASFSASSRVALDRAVALLVQSSSYWSSGHVADELPRRDLDETILSGDEGHGAGKARSAVRA